MAKKGTAKRSRNPLAAAPVMEPMQLGGIETSVLDNGPGRGGRIAWVNTGAGLRYKVAIDRGLDIADAEFLGQSLTWHSGTGLKRASGAVSQGLDWLHGFYGGLLVSCGPLNTGAPCVDEGDSLGLHGTHSNSAATIESVINPDPAAGRFEMSITGIVRTARVFDPNVELRRTIRSTLGQPVIHVHDHFINRGNTRVPHAWLLHINFGYPLLEPGASTYCYAGKLTPRKDSVGWFTRRKDFRAAPKPQEAHRGSGEVFTYVDPKAGSGGRVVCGVVNQARKFGVMIEFSKREFPRLGNWQHWGPEGAYVGALEPMTGGVEGRDIDRARGWLRNLDPGETCDYRYAITATNKPADLRRILSLNTQRV
ncbi:MAG: DUF4432 family protein [Phycisphaerae bacterium]|nr:DUF4432 family protein [Phycisphaerae bacterium]